MTRLDLIEALLTKAGALDTDIISASDEAFNAASRAARESAEGLVKTLVGALLREAAQEVEWATHKNVYSDAMIYNVGRRIARDHPDIDEAVVKGFNEAIEEIVAENRSLAMLGR